jgi:hypothetical protein
LNATFVPSDENVGKPARLTTPSNPGAGIFAPVFGSMSSDGSALAFVDDTSTQLPHVSRREPSGYIAPFVKT